MALWTVVLGSIGVVGSLFEWRGRYMGWIVRSWAKIILKASFIRFDVNGEENIKSGKHYFFAAKAVVKAMKQIIIERLYQL